MAFKKIKTINREEIDESGNVTIVPIGPLYYDKDTGDYEVRSQKSNFKTYNDSKSETVIFKNGVFQPGQTGKFGINEVNVIDDVLSTIYNIKKKIGAEAVANLPADYEQTKADTFIVEQEWKASQTNDSPGQGDVFENFGTQSGLDMQTGSSNTFLEGFQMMKYPIDADYGNTQDYMKISQYSYSPVRKGIFDGTSNPLEDFKNGVTRDNPKKEYINSVRLPIPNTLTDSNNVAWGQDTMNAMSAALAGAVSKVINPKNIEGLVNDFGGTLQKAKDAAGNAFSPDTRNAIMSDLRNILNDKQMQNVATAGLGSKVLSMLGQNMSAESILARGQGIIPNSNLELLFNSPALRKFSFTWRMSPRSREEAMMVNKIVRSFKQGMSAKKINPTSGGASFFLGTPNVFDLEFKTGGGQLIDGLFRVKTSACTSTAISYTDGAQWSAYDDGQPTSINLTLAFEELEPIYDTDYSEFPLGAGLQKVPNTSIGY